MAESLMASLVMRFRPFGQSAPGDVPSSASHQWSDVVLWVLHMLWGVSCVVARRCRAVTSCARTLASVRAAETLDISRSAAGVNAEQHVARPKHPIIRILT